MQMKFKPTINSNHKHSYTVREMEDSADFLIEWLDVKKPEPPLAYH